MSSPVPTEEQSHGASDNPEPASAAIGTESHDSKDTAPAEKQKEDAPALPPSTSSAKFAFDETLFGSMPLVGGTAIDDDEHDAYEEEGSLLPPPDFKPFFTLIEDSVTGDHHHPTVHYLFADDDQDILTAAALETISDEQQVSEDERFVIVDISPDGREVSNVSSLSPDWQTLKTKVTQAPSWGEDGKTGEKDLMLRISGQEAETGSVRRLKGDLDGYLKAFDDLVTTLDGVLGSVTAATDTHIAQ